MHKVLWFALSFILTFAGCTNKQTRLSNQPQAGPSNNIPDNWALLPFVKIDSVNPVLKTGDGRFTDPILKKEILWEEKDVFNPAIVYRAGKIYMFYRAQGKMGKPRGTSRIGLAVSTDALHFTKRGEPVLFPQDGAYKKFEWEGGCEDPRIVEDSLGTYYMTYTAYDGVRARLFVATSTDLINWKKHGSVFANAFNGKYADEWSKSGSIVSVYKDGKVIAKKINGKYWMYWGDTQVWGAVSDDLINWAPVEISGAVQPTVKLRNQAGDIPALKVLLRTRGGKFDSDLIEPGPPAMLTDKGILLLYNSRNDATLGDKSLPQHMYSASEVLFDKNDPTKVLRRLDTWIIKPEKPYEIVGQVDHVCFVEGLTFFKNKWYLYYGTADSKIAVACSVPK